MIPEHDLAGWLPTGEEWLGTKEKRWVLDPEGTLWLWKRSGLNRDAAGNSFVKGDDWSECVATEVGRTLGVPCAEVCLARIGDELGVVSRCFYRRQMAEDEPGDLPDEQLRLGNELLASIGIHSTDERDRTGYTPRSVCESLIGVSAPERPALSTFGVFVGYLILDALVGNTDRHQQNWGAIEDIDGVRRLAPSFDHASCLGFMLSDAARSDLLDGCSGRDAAAFAGRATSKFEGRPAVIDAAIEALQLLDEAEKEYWVDVIRAWNHFGQVTQAVPAHRMSPVSRSFAAAVLRSNHASLSDRLRTMCT